MKILADASLPELVEAFPKPFELSTYLHANEIPNLLKDQQILLCRSTLQVNESLLKGHSLRYVATASSGTDHIDSLYLINNAIELIDAKGSNAVAVADYVIASLAFLQKYKGFSGLKAGVIGVGEVGEKVVKRLAAAGMEVHSYDPLRSENDPHFLAVPWIRSPNAISFVFMRIYTITLPIQAETFLTSDYLIGLSPMR